MYGKKHYVSKIQRVEITQAINSQVIHVITRYPNNSPKVLSCASDKKIVCWNVDLSKLSCPSCIPVVVMKKCELDFS